MPSRVMDERNRTAQSIGREWFSLLRFLRTYLFLGLIPEQWLCGYFACAPSVLGRLASAKLPIDFMPVFEKP